MSRVVRGARTGGVILQLLRDIGRVLTFECGVGGCRIASTSWPVARDAGCCACFGVTAAIERRGTSKLARIGHRLGRGRQAFEIDREVVHVLLGQHRCLTCHKRVAARTVLEGPELRNQVIGILSGNVRPGW